MFVRWMLLGALLAPLTEDVPSCPDQGARLVHGFWEEGPPLPCGGEPAWRLYTPPHREVVERIGYRQGRAREVPRILIRYQCTGLSIWPRRLAEIKTLGYVLDVSQRRCR